ncbi:CLUMA_CG018306, isoform A [Clunio marinus]|uniref:CLUMA_CG018306, isoform A n=1 Tax=Clunio marinus TaxID=568069 RepID=A0A1J1IXM1_9DIPT|nr:CLUMA_CG018306, isoform A [Clunio marinus]
MKLIKLQFCLILIIKFAQGNPEGKIHWSSVSYTSNPAYFSDYSVNIFNDTDGETKCNATFTQLEDMEKLIITIVIKQNSKKGMKDFDRELLRINADTCKLSQGTFKNYVVRNIYREEGNPGAKIYWSSVTYTSNPMYVSDVSTNIFNDTDGDTKFNMTVTQLEDMEKLLITIVLIQNSKKGMKDFNRELLRINADTCNQFKGTFKNAIVRNIFRDIREVSNIKFSCPQPKGIFYIRELVLPGSIPFMDKFIKYALEGDFEMTVLIRAKPFKKKLTNGVSVKAYGVFTYE